MRKVSYLFLIMLVTASLLSGCAKEDLPVSEANIPSAPAMAQPLAQALKLSDEELVYEYCSGIDLALADNLLFTQAKDIPTETLYIFFCYITSPSEGSENIQEQWHNKTDDKYHVPIADIENVLNRYFDGYHFDPAQIDGYQPQTKEIVIGGLGGFGGGRFPKLVSKEQLSDDTLKLTVDYYDFDYTEVFYTKVYTIRFTEEGSQYLSIQKAE
ncbi:hypothetical protein Desde_4168 [Desulfitobacterium dehalogenans ATCC 51507]|uniref:DUF5104 domain-containing protein n=1 Tax=Desulfitobacterium dehalogenans (strain ATCC 51507 / DSM 9161 / JW/IU-DC1) TaxID=756499 RepID=I4AEP4_DESDJ|nr:hypothetical protein [Desulfitobacterium dehalogenans]AFM02429.1 hypothetical protein Desde_4168 [Desulfitobacterium dehalogenans ATCC 51507]